MKNNYRFVLFFVFGLVVSNIIGCAASVQTEQYVGEYEKQKSMDEVVVTKVDGLKILEVRANKDMEERYPELAEKRVAFGLTQELQNVVSYIGRFNMIEADRDMQLAIRNDLKANRKNESTTQAFTDNYYNESGNFSFDGKKLGMNNT